MIGEIAGGCNLGGLTNPPLEGIQTVIVPAGGAVITEFKVDVPGNYTLVDHALARAERGLLGILNVEGPKNPEIYNGEVATQQDRWYRSHAEGHHPGGAMLRRAGRSRVHEQRYNLAGVGGKAPGFSVRCGAWPRADNGRLPGLQL